MQKIKEHFTKIIYLPFIYLPYISSTWMITKQLWQWSKGRCRQVMSRNSH